MPKQVNHLVIFLSSPSDIVEERGIVKGVLNELNSTIAKQLGFHLELFGWENVYPGISTYPQNVVNQQTPQYDIFIGILWNRFGTPTNSNTSGTKEEFDIAHSRYVKKQGIHNIMFYFSNVASLMNEVDPYQLIEVRKFKDSLNDKGIFRREYSSTDEFEKLLRINLSDLLHNYHNIRPDTENESIAPDETPEENIDDSEEDMGYYEYMDIYLEHIEQSTNTLTKLVSYISEIGAKTNLATSEVEDLHTKPVGIRERLFRSIMDSLGGHLNNFSKRIEVETPIMESTFNKAIYSLNKAYNIQKTHIDSEEKNKFENDIQGLKEDTLITAKSLSDMRDAIMGTVPYTTVYAKAKKEAVKSMNKLIGILSSFTNLLDQFFED